MLIVERYLITKVCKEKKTIEVNRGSSFYSIKLSEETDLNFFEAAEVYQVSNLGTEADNVLDPVYLQIDKTNSRCAIPITPDVFIEASIDSIEHLRDEF